VGVSEKLPGTFTGILEESPMELPPPPSVFSEMQFLSPATTTVEFFWTGPYLSEGMGSTPSRNYDGKLVGSVLRSY